MHAGYVKSEVLTGVGSPPLWVHGRSVLSGPLVVGWDDVTSSGQCGTGSDLCNF